MYIHTLPQGINPEKACMLLALDDLLGINGYYDGGREFIIDYMREYKYGYSSEWMRILAECAPVIVIESGVAVHKQGEIYTLIITDNYRYRISAKDLIVVCYSTLDNNGHAACTFAKHVNTYRDVYAIVLKKHNLIVDRI